MRPERTGSSAGGLRCLAPRAALLQVVQLYIDLPPFEAPAAHFRRGRFLRRHPHAARLPSGDVTTAPRRSPLPCPRNRCFRTCRVVRIRLEFPYSLTLAQRTWTWPRVRGGEPLLLVATLGFARLACGRPLRLVDGPNGSGSLDGRHRGLPGEPSSFVFRGTVTVETWL